jgi:hypothetical protein
VVVVVVVVWVRRAQVRVELPRDDGQKLAQLVVTAGAGCDRELDGDVILLQGRTEGSDRCPPRGRQLPQYNIASGARKSSISSMSSSTNSGGGGGSSSGSGGGGGGSCNSGSSGSIHGCS